MRVKKSLSELEIKVNGLESELKILREHERSEGTMRVIENFRVGRRWTRSSNP